MYIICMHIIILYVFKYEYTHQYDNRHIYMCMYCEFPEDLEIMACNG